MSALTEEQLVAMVVGDVWTSGSEAADTISSIIRVPSGWIYNINVVSFTLDQDSASAGNQIRQRSVQSVFVPSEYVA